MALGGGGLLVLSGAISGAMQVEGLDMAIGSHTIVTFGAFCLLIACVLNVLQAAAVAGPKRLSSRTYQEMNLSCALGSLIMFIGILVSISMGFTGTVLSWACLLLSPLVFGSCATGFWVGYKY
mmetsp:Transcript_27464/g.76774  ORF Transcript_27464/g.76774 Transcript_27464/m.76774 type:complete len:123 (-) Transcript_27464:143-511(-)